MKILSVNAGSSSLKFQMYEMPAEEVLISGVFERIGMEGSFYTIKLNGEKIEKKEELKDHKRAFELLVDELMNNNIVDTLDDISGIGHRIVQGGSYFDRSVIASEEVIQKIKNNLKDIQIKSFGYPDEFIKHGDIDKIEEIYGLSLNNILNNINCML